MFIVSRGRGSVKVFCKDFEQNLEIVKKYPNTQENCDFNLQKGCVLSAEKVSGKSVNVFVDSRWSFLLPMADTSPPVPQRCRIVRLGDSRERKKRPHLVKKLNHKSIKEGIQMKQNRIFDQNSSQKARSWHYNMDTNRAEAQFADGSAIAIDCLAIEDEYGNTPAQRAELDWLLYNKPLECVQLVLSGEIEHYLSLGCDHGKLKD